MKTKQEKMQALVVEWQQSGLSQQEFARKNQLKIHCFRYWVSKYRHQSQKEPAFISLNGFTTEQICLHYPNGVELLLPAQTPLSYLNGLIHFEARCSR